MDLESLGRNIRAARQQLGLTQEDVAKGLGCSLNTYTKIERGETNVPFMRVVQIAEFLHTTVSDLSRDAGAPNYNSIAVDVIKIQSDIELIKNILAKKG